MNHKVTELVCYCPLIDSLAIICTNNDPDSLVQIEFLPNELEDIQLDFPGMIPLSLLSDNNG